MVIDPEISPSSFRALIVTEIDENQLQNDGQGCLNFANLPMKRVILPMPDIWTVAVLSWRWDTTRPGLSLNILAAVRHAKSVGIEYLFIDAISINQQRSGDSLIEEVLAFSRLYETVPVIAAYDVPGEESPRVYRLFYKTLLRPWIIHEMRKYRNNPYQVTYVGHQRDSGGCGSYYQERDIDGDSFLNIAHLIWKKDWNGYTNTILGVLTGEIGMAVVSDFRYILPAYARILDVAYETMSRNDFLLTVALLCQAATKPEAVIFESHLEAEGETRKATLPLGTFTRYAVGRTEREPNHSIHYKFFEVRLDGQKVAKWKVKERHHEDSDLCIFSVLTDAERLILNALGLEDEFQDFARNEGARRECLYLGSHEGDSKPAKVGVAYVNLDDVFVQKHLG